MNLAPERVDLVSLHPFPLPGIPAGELGFICTALAYLIYFRLIADIGPLRSLTVTFLIPPFGILWGYLVLGETLTGGFVAGGAIVCLAVWLVVSPSRAAKPAKAQPQG